MASDLKSMRVRVEQVRTQTAQTIQATRRIVRLSSETVERCRRRREDEREADLKTADRLGRSGAP